MPQAAKSEHVLGAETLVVPCAKVVPDATAAGAGLDAEPQPRRPPSISLALYYLVVRIQE